ncbi:ABC transporter substrate-binding protein [Spirulina subsalsa FACHB-351]|uniref:ABC transporter substrate-binding protein n=1 Tax=Spirulina subsalsa FACHB-351 TaxID=234711 RepID=A0ABT3L5H2_9CYAN|nr:ABC transporter substrate-binding protein [Spirulina subsalsa]MCW6036739.1 ABC transporter substrate-binding protein [Spirulina subsalsa FACHB-351]
MTQKNETKILLLSLVVTGALLAGGGWWVYQAGFLGGNTSVTGGRGSDGNLSAGGKLLTRDAPEKRAAVEAIAQNDFSGAVSRLEAYLQNNPNDPEALIYLNNARIGNQNVPTIGVAVPITGNLDAAQEILRGVAQAQKEINEQGGINGTPLKVIIGDDQNTPQGASSLARAFTRERLLGVVGHFSSENSQAAASVYQESGLVMISPTSTSVPLAQSGDHIFRTVPSDAFTAKAMVQYQLNVLNQQRAAVFFNSQSDYSQSLKNQFTQELFSSGGNVVGEYDVSSNFNARNALQDAQSKGAQVLILATNFNTLDQAVQVIQVNDRNLPLLGGDSLYTPRLLQLGADNAVGMVLAVPWHIDGNPNAGFVTRSRQLWRADVNWRTAMAYDATQALIGALRQNPTPQGVQQTLSNPSFQASGAAAEIRFLPSGDRNQAVQLVKVEAGSRSGFGYDFVPLP